MKFIYNDGGRKLSGFKGETGDCVTRSIAIATNLPYKQVYDDINKIIKEFGGGYKKVKTAYGTTYRRKYGSAREGVNKKVYHKYLESLGWKWVPTMLIGQGCKTHLKETELPKGKIIVCVSKHVTAVIDSVINDTFDPSRNGTRCVYGYFIK